MMARNNVVPLNDGDGRKPTAVKAISETEFTKLVKRCKSSQSALNSEKSTLGGIIADACEHKNLHKGAFGIYRRLDAMDPLKRAELLFHLDIYRERSDWDDQSDLFNRDAEAAE